MVSRAGPVSLMILLLFGSHTCAVPAGAAQAEKVQSYLKRASDEAASIVDEWERQTALMQLGSLRNQLGDVSGAEELARTISSDFGTAAGFRVLVEQKVRAGDLKGALALASEFEDQDQRDSVLYYIVYSLAVDGNVKAARNVERMLVGRVSRYMAAEVLRSAEVATHPAEAEKTRAEGTPVSRSRIFWFAARLCIERGDLKLATTLAEQIEIPAGKAEVFSWILRALEADGDSAEATQIAGAVREAANQGLPQESGQWAEVNRAAAMFSVARFEATSGLAEQANRTYVEAEQLARDAEGRHTDGPTAHAERKLTALSLAVPRVEVLLSLDRNEEAIRYALMEEVAPVSPHCFATIARWHAYEERYDAVEKLAGVTTSMEQRCYVWLGAAEGTLALGEGSHKPAVDEQGNKR